ncbi:MAG TPA: phospho-sugar mutase [Phycicoccus elongatus]|uniref:phospho-sugar mutase n=1 Tax=Phycicoccus elongatus TaxID=101689 RepID=UPI002C497CF7|nr:phospho-sugar mutase [Phycicoccus elongatus]HPK13300.1 phospho-sugar mutase [Phycicoccus elongatus]
MAVHGGPLGSRGSGEAVHPTVLEAARAWAADDPDPVTAAELDAIITAADGGDREAAEDLADRMSGLLEFGTAGLRGALGAGPNRMNRSVVIRAAAGLTAYLKSLSDSPFVVVGFDARTNSDVFARDTCAVVVGAGGRAALMPRTLPTPVLAYAVRALGADAGVMVTASHNPPQDNGYKVYVGDGSQIVPPVDSMIADQIGRIERVAEVPLADGGWEVVEESVITDYVRDAASVVAPTAPRDLTVVHTAMHGVGTETIRAAFAAAGFAEPISVVAQAEPDPMFPTVSFPNPEEPGAMDLALELAEQTGPDLVIANDPDADRCAAAVAGPGGWRMLRGDEVGALLGSHVIARGVPEGGVLANSIVSSRMLATMARAAGVSHEETLTGFKWIGRVPGLAYGYEEALGYCVDPDHVKDKDGVTAALMLAELAATEKAAGRDLTDRLDDLAREHGVHATDAFSIRVEDLSIIGRIMERLRADPPASVAGVEVSRLDDLAEGDGGLPPTEGLRWYLTDASRIIVRPSGTEPKLKVYLEVIEPVTGDDLRGARERAASRLAALRAAYEGFTSI